MDRIARMREIFLWPGTRVIGLRARLTWQSLTRTGVGSFERLIDFLKYLVSPVADSRPYPWIGGARGLRMCESSSRKAARLLFLPSWGGGSRVAIGGAFRGALLDCEG